MTFVEVDKTPYNLFKKIMKTIKKKIYFYSTQAHYEDQVQLGRTPMLKIGDTQQEEAEDRINQQDTTSNPQHLITKGVFETTFGDKEFHRHLLKCGYKKTRVDKDREWFYITVEDAIYELEQYQGSQSVSKIAENRELFKHQKEFVTKIMSTWEQWKEFLLFAKCRAGKSTMVYSAIVESGVKITLIVSRFKSPKQSWMGDVRFKNFENLIFIDLNKKGYNKEIERYLKTDKQIILWKCIQSQNTLLNLPCNVDLIVYDEAHQGYTGKQWVKVKDVHDCKVIYVTGTAYKLRYDPAFTEENTYTYSYYEEQLDAKLGLNQGRKIPKLKLFVANYFSEQYQKLFGDDPAAMKNLFNTLVNGDFVHPHLVQEFVEMYFSNKGQRHLRPEQRIFKDCNHIYATLPSVAACHAFAKFLVGSRFAPLVVTGETENDAETINNHIEANPCGTIILTRSANVLGVTAPKIDTVINLTEGKSLEFYVQFAFRGGSGEKDWNLFDFCPERALSTQQQLFNIACDSNSELAEYKFTEFVDIYSWFNGFKKLTEEEISEILASDVQNTIDIAASFVNGMDSEVLRNIDCTTDFQSGDASISKKEVNTNNTNSKTNKKSLTQPTTKEREDQKTKEQVREYMKRVPIAVFHCVRKNVPTNNVENFLKSEHYVMNTGDSEEIIQTYLKKTSGKERERLLRYLTTITNNIKSSIQKDECVTLNELPHSRKEHQVLDLEFIDYLLSA